MASQSHARLSDRERVSRFARECQLLAGHLLTGSARCGEADGILRSLLRLASSSSGPATEAILSSLATQAVLRIRRSTASWDRSWDAVLLMDLSHATGRVASRVLQRCIELFGEERIRRRAPEAGRRMTRVVSALDFVRAHYSDCSLRLETVARSVNLSSWHLDHLLKCHTGHAFRHHLRTARVEAAEALLLTSHLTVKEISAIVGYNSTTQLDRDFNRRHGCSPSAWVKQTVPSSRRERSIAFNADRVPATRRPMSSSSDPGRSPT